MKQRNDFRAIFPCGTTYWYYARPMAANTLHLAISSAFYRRETVGARCQVLGGPLCRPPARLWVEYMSKWVLRYLCNLSHVCEQRERERERER